VIDLESSQRSLQSVKKYLLETLNSVDSFYMIMWIFPDCIEKKKYPRLLHPEYYYVFIHCWREI